eukprot:CAMPEP_0196583816 /NCGR_PEP_ID=MMETSP1081-20130531/44797_1 /TAXON_ID=36882 /ORGANISM="Pyramimonas amylifera, Strain CCMP720" /LENGTH=48 /DNA_ID= /DNA_START= /DNA_END= /DNA_ORIENTATION=
MTPSSFKPAGTRKSLVETQDAPWSSDRSMKTRQGPAFSKEAGASQAPD